MLIPKDLPEYHSYLLRFWHEGSRQRVDAWRFSLEDPRSGVRMGFDSLAGLVTFLAETVHECEVGTGNEGDHERRGTSMEAATRTLGGGSGG